MSELSLKFAVLTKIFLCLKIIIIIFIIIILKDLELIDFGTIFRSEGFLFIHFW